VDTNKIASQENLQRHSRAGVQLYAHGQERRFLNSNVSCTAGAVHTIQNGLNHRLVFHIGMRVDSDVIPKRAV